MPHDHKPKSDSPPEPPRSLWLQQTFLITDGHIAMLNQRFGAGLPPEGVLAMEAAETAKDQHLLDLGRLAAEGKAQGKGAAEVLGQWQGVRQAAGQQEPTS
jgi:hypothetical protein